MEQSTLNLLGHLSFFMTSISFLMKDMILLRSLAIVSCGLGIAYNYHVVSNPLWLVIFWLSLFLCINIYQIGKIVIGQKPIKLNERERTMHGNSFGSFSAHVFKNLLDLGKWESETEGTILTKEGESVRKLFFIYSGEVEVTKNNQEIARLSAGSLVGEMSFLRQKTASATTKITKETIFFSWPHKKLRTHLSRNPMMKVAMMTALNSDLLKKLAD